MADEGAAKPEGEAPPEEKPPEGEAQPAEQPPADAPAGEAPPAEEAKPEGGEAEAAATEQEAAAAATAAAEGAAEPTSSKTSEPEAPPSEAAPAAPEESGAPDTEKSARTLDEQKKSAERLSLKKQPSKGKEGEAKKKSKSIIFEEREPEKPQEEELTVEIGPPAETSTSAVEVKVPKRRSRPPKSETRGRQTVSGRGKRATVFRAKGDFEGRPRYQNTYRLDSKNPFSSDRVYTIIKTTMDAALQDLRYNPDECSKLVATLANEIKDKVKLQNYERYKIAVQVFIGERKEQSVYSIMRFLWDVERDHYSIYSYESTTLFAIGIAAGVYYE